MHILVVNINNLAYTKGLINCLLIQTRPYCLTIVDQNSIEEGTKYYLSFTYLKYLHMKVIFNKKNIPLSRLWNQHYLNSESDLICFLNNDVIIPSNFVKDTVDIFNKEPSVGCVIHATNHPLYQETSNLKYEILTSPVTQGWDFTIRKSAYHLIPEEIKFFGGDDFLFNKLYEDGWKVAIALSSPIIHFKAKSRRYYPGDRQQEAEICANMGIKRFPYRCPFTKPYPNFEKIIEGVIC